MTSKTDTPTGPNTANHHPSITNGSAAKPLLPPPKTLDILPDLHRLLSRLLPPRSTSYKDPEPLQPKNVESEAAELRIRLQKAKVEVEALPDMDRSLSEQQEEIARLEERIRGLKGVLGEVGQMAGEGGSRAK